MTEFEEWWEWTDSRSRVNSSYLCTFNGEWITKEDAEEIFEDIKKFLGSLK